MFEERLRSIRGLTIMLGVCVAASGCLGGDDQGARSDAPSWLEFKQRASRAVAGGVIYVIEGDIAVSEGELRAYYDRYIGEGGVATIEQESVVNTVGGADDVWPGQGQLDLTYCVSDEFGSNKARAVSEMAQATAAWQSAAHVRFRYVPSHDASCNNGNAGIVFSVRPWTSGGACAFFPSGGGCVARTLVIDFHDLDTNPFYATNSPNVRTVGVFRHELGHILGLRHEQIRPEAATACSSENTSWRGTTTYDKGSVMHYPWCNGLSTSDLSITNFDVAGAQALYGTPNLAIGRPASQSSTVLGADASRAVDGSTDGNWPNNSVTHTNADAQAWWQVDLGAVTDIGAVVLYNRTDCCGDRLADFDVLVSSDGASWHPVAASSGAATPRAAFSVDAVGRYVRVQLRGTNYLSLAEVQVFAPRNLAAGKTTAQSSTVLGGDASRAVDGNPDGNWANNSVTHTNADAQAWWQVDLGAVTEIGKIVLHNRTDCCGDRLADFDVWIHDGVGWQRAVTFAGAAPARTALSINAAARYVHIQLRGTNYLSLAEVQVFAPENLAAGKTTAQSSTVLGAEASRAVDGNPDGNWPNNSVTHTDADAQAWWQVDLGAVADIGEVVLYNRTDCCGDRLSNLQVLASTDGASWSPIAALSGTAGARTALTVAAAARFVRVQLSGTNYLSLAEVRVFRPRNLAAGKAAAQSSTVLGGDASRAADGYLDGNWPNNSVTHTNADTNAWWLVDLGDVTSVGKVVLHNRTDCCGDRLSDFWVLASADGASWSVIATHSGAAGARAAFTVSASARWIAVQLAGTNYLSLAEVQVMRP